MYIELRYPFTILKTSATLTKPPRRNVFFWELLQLCQTLAVVRRFLFPTKLAGRLTGESQTGHRARGAVCLEPIFLERRPVSRGCDDRTDEESPNSRGKLAVVPTPAHRVGGEQREFRSKDFHTVGPMSGANRRYKKASWASGLQPFQTPVHSLNRKPDYSENPSCGSNTTTTVKRQK